MFKPSDSQARVLNVLLVLDVLVVLPRLEKLAMVDQAALLADLLVLEENQLIFIGLDTSAGARLGGLRLADGRAAVSASIRDRERAEPLAAALVGSWQFGAAGSGAR